MYHCAMPQGDASAQLDFDAIGRALVALCGAYHALGHVSAVGTVQDYAPSPDGYYESFVWDMFSACSLKAVVNEEPRARLAEFVDRHGLLDLIAEAVAR